MHTCNFDFSSVPVGCSASFFWLPSIDLKHNDIVPSDGSAIQTHAFHCCWRNGLHWYATSLPVWLALGVCEWVTPHIFRHVICYRNNDWWIEQPTQIAELWTICHWWFVNRITRETTAHIFLTIINSHLMHAVFKTVAHFRQKGYLVCQGPFFKNSTHTHSCMSVLACSIVAVWILWAVSRRLSK